MDQPAASAGNGAGPRFSPLQGLMLKVWLRLGAADLDTLMSGFLLILPLYAALVGPWLSPVHSSGAPAQE